MFQRLRTTIPEIFIRLLWRNKKLLAFEKAFPAWTTPLSLKTQKLLKNKKFFLNFWLKNLLLSIKIYSGSLYRPQPTEQQFESNLFEEIEPNLQENEDFIELEEVFFDLIHNDDMLTWRKLEK